MFDMGSSKVRGADKPKIEKFGMTLALPETPAFPITPISLGEASPTAAPEWLDIDITVGALKNSQQAILHEFGPVFGPGDESGPGLGPGNFNVPTPKPNGRRAA